MEIPRPDGVLDRFKHRVLADALLSAQQQRVVDLLARALHAVSQPMDDMRGIARRVEYPVDMVGPRRGLRGISQLDARRAIEIETRDALPLDPSAVDHQPVQDQLR